MAAKRGTYRRSSTTREAIVVAAREVLTEDGFHGMSIARVAERSEMTRAGLMYHFPSREHLLLAVMEGRFEENGVWFREQAAIPGHSILDVFIDLMTRHSEDPEAATLLMVLAGASVDPSNPAHEWYVGRYEFLRAAGASRVRLEQESGEIRDDIEAMTIATQLITTMEGLLLQWLNDRDAVDMRAVMTAYCDVLRAR